MKDKKICKQILIYSTGTDLELFLRHTHLEFREGGREKEQETWIDDMYLIK